MQACNPQSFKSSPEVKIAELQLIKHVRITDTFQIHDTLTAIEDLVANTSKFYQLAESIVGTNFMRYPH